MVTRHDYAGQAAGYDRTRSASPSILRPIAEALAGSPGPLLLDVGGGTGNYAVALRDEGFAPVVVDASEAMLERAAAKGLLCVRGDAARLPFATGRADAVVMISMLHLAGDWRSAVAEAMRVLRPGGRLAIQAFTRENLEVHWIFGYFPSARSWVWPEHQPLGDLLAALPGARAVPFEFRDILDASMAAMCRRPEMLLDPACRSQTSFFARLAARDPGELARGIARLEQDIAAGRRLDDEAAGSRRRWGDGTVIAWQSPRPA